MRSIVHVAIFLALSTVSSRADDGDFNKYVLQSAKFLAENYSNGGYSLNNALTHDLEYNGSTIPSTQRTTAVPRESMCVAGMLEVMVHALDFWSKENGNNKKPFSDIPVESWRRLRPTDLRAHLWVDSRLGSYGTGDAMRNFGIGENVSFAQLRPGDFANINRPKLAGRRSSPSGHAVVFLDYIDEQGTPTAALKAKGIKYFSHQSSTNGFGEKYGFFLKSGEWFCPSLPGKSVDCGIMFSNDQRFLTLGRMWSPTRWDSVKRESYLTQLMERLRQQTNVRGEGFLNITPNLTQDQFNIEIERGPDVMTLNPLFANGANE
ncbi:hypothetical protein [Tardiphaga sp. 841_E9_N1_2]|uniref:hypothetical protein n=1 Tax=Tardiphaga sp. 841_E9_N1_2 TaxID=3240762 RepID=UPI003F2776C9